MSVLFFIIVRSPYFSFVFVFVESCCYICIVLCLSKEGFKLPLPQRRQNWKAGRGLKRAIVSSEKSTVIYADFKVESFQGSECIGKRAMLGAQSCHLCVVLAGLRKLDVYFVFTCVKSVFHGQLQI
uniref:Uncharacterized protein n=1 Tax=Myotis myotis TaxID=51298 RepID=A0A7J7UD07_MYOMY|nr:hypothetical protein mMyoMyo1_008768 [Myotis myotis]